MKCNVACWNPSWEIHSNQLEPGTGKAERRELHLGAASIAPPQAGNGRSIMLRWHCPIPSARENSWCLSWAGFEGTGREGGGVHRQPDLGLSGSHALQQHGCNVFPCLCLRTSTGLCVCMMKSLFLSMNYRESLEPLSAGHLPKVAEVMWGEWHIRSS